MLRNFASKFIIYVLLGMLLLSVMYIGYMKYITEKYIEDIARISTDLKRAKADLNISAFESYMKGVKVYLEDVNDTYKDVNISNDIGVYVIEL